MKSLISIFFVYYLCKKDKDNITIVNIHEYCNYIRPVPNE